MAKKSYVWCQKCSRLIDIDQPCEHGRIQADAVRPDSPHIITFKPYVDEHISTDGKPVLITDASQKRALMRSQWNGDWQAKIIERDSSTVQRKVKERLERLLDTRKQ